MKELGIILVVVGIIILLFAIIKSIVTCDPLKAFWGDDCYDEGGIFFNEVPIIKHFFRPTFWKKILIVLSPFAIIVGIVFIIIF